jgi:hypothetical protein
MSTRIATVIVLSCAMWAASVGQAAAEHGDMAGRVKIAAGAVFVIRAGAERPVAVGEPVYETDIVKTGADGRLGLTLEDDTRISLGPSSEVRIDAFHFAPGESPLAVVLTFVRGVAGYVSGRIAKLAPDAVRLKTPSAIIGVRGTTVALRVAS